MKNATRIWQALEKNNVDKVAYYPCNKLNDITKTVPESVEVWDMTKESVGVALCFGRSLDNGSCGSTGNQPSLSANGFNLSALPRSVGIETNWHHRSARRVRETHDGQGKLHPLSDSARQRQGRPRDTLKAIEIKERFKKRIN